MIHRKIFPALLMLVAMCFFAQEMLTNESILKLCKAGVGDDTIVDMIKAQPSKFSLRTDDIIALKSAGITEKVIAAMVAKGAGAITAKADPARSDPPSLTQNGITLPDELGVYWIKDGKYVAVAPEILNLRTSRAAQLMVGIMANAKLNGWVTQQHSRTHLGPESEFIVKLPEGTDPAEYVCVKFQVKGDRREVELARGRINISTGTHRSEIPFTSEKLAKQVYRLKFGGGFRAGDYGLLPPGANISANVTSAGKIYTFMVE